MKQYYETLVTLKAGQERRGSVKNKELEYGWYTLYTRMNIEILNCLKPHKKGTMV
jgi:hypothetical protein